MFKGLRLIKSSQPSQRPKSNIIFKFKNLMKNVPDVVYTEDNVIVRKLFLYHVADELTVDSLKSYFETFGTVEDVEIQPKRKHKSKSGNVTFADPHSAAKVLRQKVHHVDQCRLSVTPNDSWNQPDAYSLSAESGDDTVSIILKLNDNCLVDMVRLLSLPDRIHLARTCMRFRSVYKQVSVLLDKSISFDVFDSLTVWDMRDFFVLSGEHVKEIKGQVTKRNDQRLYKFLGLHCVNLKSMDIWDTELTMRDMNNIFAKLNELEDLKLRTCALNNDSLRALKHLTQLKKLDLSNNKQLTGLHMNDFPASIVSLTLTCCIGLQSKFLPGICLALHQLKELHLKGIFTLGPSFRLLVNDECCESLETITISCGPSFDFEYIAQLPRLKKLIIHSKERNVLKYLVDHKSKQLQHFEAHGQNNINADMILQISQLSALQTLIVPNNIEIFDKDIEKFGTLQALEVINLRSCHNISNKGVLLLILACPKLQVLHLEKCPNLSNMLLFDIIAKLRLQIRQMKPKRSLPIKLNVYGTQINETCLQDPDVAAKDIIDASLEPPALFEHEAHKVNVCYTLSRDGSVVLQPIANCHNFFC